MQNSLKLMLSLLITVLLLSSGCSASEKSANDAPQATTTKSDSQVKTTADKLLVLYFHTEYRCWSCNQFEKLTKEVIEESFPEQLKNNNIEFKSINIETETNKHFIEDYKLVTKSVILSLRKADTQIEWKNMDQIWMLIRDTVKFKSYIKDGISSYMSKVKKS